MKKFLIIRSNQESSWGSCKVISPNLQECYNLLKGTGFEVEYFDIEEKFLKSDALEDGTTIIRLAEKIENYKPTEIVFSDHLPHADDVLKFLSFYIPLAKLPPLVFHVYGDFTYHSHSWWKLGEKLKDHPVKFIVASESQERLFRSFCYDDSTLETFMFPVNGKDYHFNEQERIQTRAENKIIDDELVIMYAGRISLQKNLETLIMEYAELVRTSDRPTRLWLVGGFDDMGAPFQGVIGHDGMMFDKINRMIESLPQKVRATITLWGNQPKTTLRKLKNAADMFMSFSLYHDEDYGMSPAEALACGLPALLTDWGGYSSFVSASGKWTCRLMPVKLTKYGHELTVSRIREFFDQQKAVKSEASTRRKNAEEFMKEFSIVNGAGKLKKILNKEFKAFSGFTINLEYYSKVYWSVRHGYELNIQLTPSDDNFYYQVYKHYISGKET